MMSEIENIIIKLRGSKNIELTEKEVDLIQNHYQSRYNKPLKSCRSCIIEYILQLIREYDSDNDSITKN